MTSGKTNDNIRCAVCGSENEEGFYLEPENSKERKFLTYFLQDEQNWVIGHCCIPKFDNEIKQIDSHLKVRSDPPDEIVDQLYDIRNIPQKLLVKIDTEHKFYIITTKLNEKFFGFLFDYSDLGFHLTNCFQIGKNKEWIKSGVHSELMGNNINIPIEDIADIEKAPYSASYKDDGLPPPFTDKKDDFNWDSK